MKRTQLTLLGLLVLQIVLILIFRSPLSTASARADTRPLLPGLEAISPARLEIDGADDERITLVRDGEGWAIEEIGGFPADDGKVESLLENLEQIEVRRPVVTSSSYHQAFKVTQDDNEARLRLFAAGDDAALAELILGSSSNYRTTHARLAGQDAVYEIQGLAAYDVRPEHGSWIRKELAGDVGDEVNRLTLRNAQADFELEKQDGVWVVASPSGRQDEELDQDEILALLRMVTGLRLVDAVGPLDQVAQGFVDPAATLVLGWGAGETEGAGAGELTLQVGSKVSDAETQRYVTRSGLGFTGTIWESSINRLLEDGLDELRAETEADAPAIPQTESLQ